MSSRTSSKRRRLHHLGLALGGRPAASFAKRLMVPVSNYILLCVVRRQVRPKVEPLAVIGIDYWAFRRNHRYGSIIYDLERRRIVALLPDRDVTTVEAWLSTHPETKIISRDHGGGYGDAAARALPNAIQVADRWHLMENASAAFLYAVRKSMRTIRTALGATMVNPDLLTYAEKLQYDGYSRREETNSAIMKLVGAGVSIKEIVRRTGYSRKLVRQVTRGQQTDAVVVSAHVSLRDLKPAFFPAIAASVLSRSRVDRASRSRRVTSSTSPLPKLSMARFSAARSVLAPLAVSRMTFSVPAA